MALLNLDQLATFRLVSPRSRFLQPVRRIDGLCTPAAADMLTRHGHPPA